MNNENNAAAENMNLSETQTDIQNVEPEKEDDLDVKKFSQRELNKIIKDRLDNRKAENLKTREQLQAEYEAKYQERVNELDEKLKAFEKEKLDWEIDKYLEDNELPIHIKKYLPNVESLEDFKSRCSTMVRELNIWQVRRNYPSGSAEPVVTDAGAKALLKLAGLGSEVNSQRMHVPQQK